MTPLAVLVLAVGTYLLRLGGPLLAVRLRLSERAPGVVALAPALLLSALAATSALADGHGFAGWSRPAGVLVGGVLAFRRAPFVLVVLVAAATTALLRLAGVR